MIRLRPFEIKLLEQVGEQLLTGCVGLIYLDIRHLSHIRDRHGRSYCEQILKGLRQVIQETEQEYSSLLGHKMVGDDFFVYVLFEQMDARQAETRLHDACAVLKAKIEARLRELFPEEPSLVLYGGCALLENDPGKEIGSIIYSAMKTAIRESKIQSVETGSADRSSLSEFRRILAKRDISTVYQPIVSLVDGRTLGYEALTRGPEDSKFHSPLPLFQMAEKTGALYELDKLARETAIRSCSGLHPHQKVFINIPASIIHDPEFSQGQTMLLLRSVGLQPTNVVFEITERSSIEDFSTVKKVLRHYRKQGYQIAIDDAGAGYSSLEAIAELQPDYIKVDRSLVNGIHQDRIKEYILETFVTFAAKMNIRIIAEGIEHTADLDKLMRMGVHYAQGYYLGRPKPGLVQVPDDITDRIRYQSQMTLSNDGQWQIGGLAAETTAFPEDTSISEVSSYLKVHDEVQGVVIVNAKHEPIGLMMRDKLFQELSGQYGISLYWNKPIHQLMDKAPLIVDEKLSLEQVSHMAMSRDTRNLYDLVIITRDKRFLGTTSIRALLESITNIRMERARVANPLTGLPGNVQIQRELSRKLLSPMPFSVLYADLDYFKWFNDRFGFKRGDELIQLTAELLQEWTSKHGIDAFVGHIGGDDFIVITSETTIAPLCKSLIEQFDQEIRTFYGDADDLRVKDRHGREVHAQGVSLSLSGVICENEDGLLTSEAISYAAAELKKQAKSLPGSVFIHERIGSGTRT